MDKTGVYTFVVMGIALMMAALSVYSAVRLRGMKKRGAGKPVVARAWLALYSAAAAAALAFGVFMCFQDLGAEATLNVLVIIASIVFCFINEALNCFIGVTPAGLCFPKAKLPTPFTAKLKGSAIIVSYRNYRGGYTKLRFSAAKYISVFKEYID